MNKLLIFYFFYIKTKEEVAYLYSMKHLIAPSVLAADFTRLKEEIELINNSEADWFHLDVMDGRFVPNISFGMFIIKAINQIATKPLDVHLMIVEPEKYIEQFREAGADVITVHYEACPHLHRTVQQIKASGAKAGVALNPHTPVRLLKVRQLRDLIDTRNTGTKIEIDGGVGLQNAEVLLQAGADVLVAGSSIFRAKHPLDVISRMKSIGKDTLMV